MNPATRPRITEQTLSRLCLWLALIAARLIAPALNAIAPRAAARLLDEYARIAAMLLVARAVKRIAFKAPRLSPCWGRFPVERRRLNVRRVAGARLRRALRVVSRDDRARALCAVLAAAERWIAHITRRLQRGFTKLRRLPKLAQAQLCAYACAPAGRTHAADTS